LEKFHNHAATADSYN